MKRLRGVQEDRNDQRQISEISPLDYDRLKLPDARLVAVIGGDARLWTAARSRRLDGPNRTEFSNGDAPFGAIVPVIEKERAPARF